MKKSLLSFGVSAVSVGVLLFLGGSCVSSTGAGPVGELVGWTGCKGSTGLSAPPMADARAAGTECVEYEYDGRSVLRLKHVDAGFNCCPGTISADIDIDGREILITERESSSLCDCSCLFDVNYEIVAVAPGTYRITVVGPYQNETDPPLEFRVELSRAASGSYCVERTHYPWGY